MFGSSFSQFQRPNEETHLILKWDVYIYNLTLCVISLSHCVTGQCIGTAYVARQAWSQWDVVWFQYSKNKWCSCWEVTRWRWQKPLVLIKTDNCFELTMVIMCSSYFPNSPHVYWWDKSENISLSSSDDLFQVQLLSWILPRLSSAIHMAYCRVSCN